MNDGGPAFPGSEGANGYGNNRPIHHADGSVTWEALSPGMTLRDYFAAKAMQAIYAGEGARMVADRDQRYDETNWDFIVASNAYMMADAMLAERAKAVKP